MSTQRQFLLGIFFLTALSILAFYTLFLTDITLFSDPIVMKVYFPGAHGLREGDPVMVSGLRIGRVGELGYEPSAPAEQRIQATLFLNEELELLEDAVIAIEESTLLGGRQVDIFPGTPGGPPSTVPPGGFYRGVVKRNPIAALGAVGELLSENREALKSILDNVDLIVANAAAGKGSVGRILADEEMAQDLADSVANVRAVTDDARSVMADLRAGQGVLGSLVYDDQLLNEVKDTISGLQTIVEDVRAGSGVAGQLLYGEELAAEVRRAVEAFANVGTRIDRGEGVAGKLLSDPALGEELALILHNFRDASASIQRIAAHVESGEGTVGKLLMDEELYAEAMSSVKLLTRSLEDYREAAPISTFTGVLFSAF